MSVSYCTDQNKACVVWVEKYFKDCLCNLRDEFSFAFGLVSLVCWGVAEIPQIITNFRTKSSHGVSLAFLLTWVAGDVFNMVGCLLEPATVSGGFFLRWSKSMAWAWFGLAGSALPTQYYTALLYTTSTIVLVIQSVYYDHFYKWCNRRRKPNTKQSAEEDQRKPLKHGNSGGDESGIPIPRATTKSSAVSTPRKEFYYTSARSLAGSGTPPFRNYLRVARSGPSAMAVESDSSSDDEVSAPIPIRTIPKSVAGYGTFLATSFSLPRKSNALTQVYVGLAARKLLSQNNSSESNTVYGQWLGWMMAAIYMGGRLPQIWLNIKRGSVEGLNPLMFLFALIANVAYVASILVRSSEWERIKANLPWLLDAVVCVALDLFIILQYVYYKYLRTGIRRGEEYYEEASKS